MAEDRQSAVENGVLNFVSPSQVVKANKCLRQWWYNKVQKLPEPQGKGAARGEKYHKEVETYLKTRSDVLSVRPVKEILDPILELQGFQVEKETSFKLLSGIELRGRIDLVYRAHGELVIWDHKFLGDLRYATTPDRLREEVPMNMYALSERGIHDTKFRFVHMNVGVGKPKVEVQLTQCLVDTEHLFKQRDLVELTVEKMQQAAQQKSSEKVEANTKTCNMHGGCPRKDICSAFRQSQLDLAYGGTDMSIKEQLERAKNAAAPTATKSAPVSKEFSDAIQTLETSGLGMPTLRGSVAFEYSKLKGKPPTETIPGSGTIASVEVNAISVLFELVKELRTEVPAEKKDEALDGFVAVLPPEAAEVPEKPFEPVVEVATVAETPPTPVVASPTPSAPKKRKVTPPPAPVAPAPAPSPNPTILVSPDQPELVATLPVVVESPKTETIQIFANCITTEETKPLYPYVRGLCAELERKFDAVDIRCAHQDTPLGFGKWKGALAGLVRAKLPAPGKYNVELDEISEIVVAELRMLGHSVTQGYK